MLLHLTFKSASIFVSFLSVAKNITYAPAFSATAVTDLHAAAHAAACVGEHEICPDTCRLLAAAQQPTPMPLYGQTAVSAATPTPTKTPAELIGVGPQVSALDELWARYRWGVLLLLLLAFAVMVLFALIKIASEGLAASICSASLSSCRRLRKMMDDASSFNALA